MAISQVSQYCVSRANFSDKNRKTRVRFEVKTRDANSDSGLGTRDPSIWCNTAGLKLGLGLDKKVASPASPIFRFHAGSTI